MVPFFLSSPYFVWKFVLSSPLFYIKNGPKSLFCFLGSLMMEALLFLPLDSAEMESFQTIQVLLHRLMTGPANIRLCELVINLLNFKSLAKPCIHPCNCYRCKDTIVTGIFQTDVLAERSPKGSIYLFTDSMFW